MWELGKVPPETPRAIPQRWAPPPDAAQLYILALDPGVASGWCALRLPWAALVAGGFRSVMQGRGGAWCSGELRGPEGYQAELFLAMARGLWAEGEWELGRDSDRFVIVIEDFILREFSMDRSLLAPVRVTAMVKALSWRRLIPPVVLFSAADALASVPDERLRAYGLWVGGPDHQRDATRHAVLAARRMVEERFRSVTVARMPWLVESFVEQSG